MGIVVHFALHFYLIQKCSSPPPGAQIHHLLNVILKVELVLSRQLYRKGRAGPEGICTKIPWGCWLATVLDISTFLYRKHACFAQSPLEIQSLNQEAPEASDGAVCLQFQNYTLVWRCF